MKAWYYQNEDRTYAYAVLRGIHGERKDIPALRTYFVCDGEGIFTINGTDHIVGEGSIIQISAHATYDFHSTGEEPIKFFVDIGVKLDFDTIPSR